MAIHRAPGNPVTTYTIASNSSNISFNLNQTPTPGNILFIHIMFSAQPSTPTIGNPAISGCTYTGRYASAGVVYTGTFTVGASPGNTVTIAVSGGTCDFAICVVEYINLSSITTDIVGSAANTYQFTNPVHNVIGTLSQAQEIAWAQWYCFGTAFSGWGATPSGWNILLQTVNASGWSVALFEQLTTSNASQNLSLQANGTINTAVGGGGSGYYETLGGIVAADAAIQNSGNLIATRTNILRKRGCGIFNY